MPVGISGSAANLLRAERAQAPTPDSWAMVGGRDWAPDRAALSGLGPPGPSTVTAPRNLKRESPSESQAGPQEPPELSCQRLGLASGGPGSRGATGTVTVARRRIGGPARLNSKLNLASVGRPSGALSQSAPEGPSLNGAQVCALHWLHWSRDS